MQENENSFSENAVQEEVLINQLIEECKKNKEDYQNKYSTFQNGPVKGALAVSCFSIVVIIFFVLFINLDVMNQTGKANDIFLTLAIYSIGISVCFLLVVFSLCKCIPFLAIIKIRRCNTELLNYAKRLIQLNVSQNYVGSMMQLSYSYLDDYYLLTSKQANKSFAVMLAVSIGGAILIGIGIVGTFLGNLENIYLVYLSTITGIIIEFISAIFFYFYNNTIIRACLKNKSCTK